MNKQQLNSLGFKPI